MTIMTSNNPMQMSVKSLDPAGREMKTRLAEEWQRFLNGHWQNTPPTRRGRYVIAHRTGRIAGDAFVYESEGRLVVSHRDSGLHPLKSGWNGWWWSEPIPVFMPHKPPQWDGAAMELPPQSPGAAITREEKTPPVRLHLRLVYAPEDRDDEERPRSE